MGSKEPRHRDWVKLWVKEALLGTIREDLTPDERGTWYDFLLLAGNSRIPGVICANQTTALPVKRIAGILNITESLVNRCTRKFLESGRITVDKNGVIAIVNWSRYQYTDYDRQKPWRDRQRVKPEPEPTSDLEQFIEELRPQYPSLDVDNELIKFNLYWSEGKRVLKRPKLALKNWLDKARKFQGDDSKTPDSTTLIPPEGDYIDEEGMRVIRGN